MVKRCLQNCQKQEDGAEDLGCDDKRLANQQAAIGIKCRRRSSFEGITGEPGVGCHVGFRVRWKLRELAFVSFGVVLSRQLKA